MYDGVIVKWSPEYWNDNQIKYEQVSKGLGKENDEQ